MASRVAVAGGGVSGLAIARALRDLGVDAVVLDGGARPGGPVASEREDGWLWERGPTAALDRDGAVERLSRALGIGDRLVEASPRAKRRYLWWRGRLRPAPVSPPAFLGSDLLSARDKLRVLCDLVIPRGPAGRGGDESVAAFARRRLGTAFAERLVGALVAGVYGGDARELSVSAAFPRLAAIERDHRSLILGAARIGRSGPAGAMRSFRGGMGELAAALAAGLGDALRCRARVQRVEASGRTFRVRVEERGGGADLEAGAVVVALPAAAAGEAVAGLDAAAADAARGVRYAPIAVAHLGFARADVPHPLDGFGFLVPPGEGRRILGTIFVSSVFPDRAPSDHVLLTTMVGGAIRPDLAALGEDELGDLVRAELRDALGIAAAPAFARVVRHPRAIPQYTLGHRDRVAALDAAETRLPGLFFAGNAFRGVSVADCVAAAPGIAARVAAHLRGGG